MTRSQHYARLADMLATTCSATINNDGSQRCDEIHGKLPIGNIFYVVGEMVRLRSADVRTLCGKDFVGIASSLLGAQGEETTLVRGFMSMGLAMLGPAQRNIVIQSLNPEQQAQLHDKLQVTEEFSSNWEAFNASIRIGRSVLYGDEPDLVLLHLRKIEDKFLVDGYYDDSADFGDYNSYGLMCINFALRISEYLEMSHPVRLELETMFRPHALRYFALLQVLIHHNGQGWVFGRSAGCLGQLQCLVFIEQLLAKGWLDDVQSSWARRACTLLLEYMHNVFWDEDMVWFSFRDDQRSCYRYRASLPMAWDLWRYFLQLESYAVADEKRAPQQHCDDTINTESQVVEVISSERRKTSYFVWSDGTTRIQMPVMGGPGHLTGDNLPRPYCPGVFEWVTHSLVPVLCPRLTINWNQFWPAWWPSATKLTVDGDQAKYTVTYANLVDSWGKPAKLGISWEVTYLFASGHFERHDAFHLSRALDVAEIRMEVLQGKAHPKAIAYPPVRQLHVSGGSNIDGLSLNGPEDVGDDSTYVNYYAHAEKRWVFSGKKLILAAGDYEIRTLVDYE